MSAELHHGLEGPEDAPPLVLSNSLGTRLEMWDDQAPALAERFRVLRYDTRGHGRSEVPDGPYSIAELGQDVLDLLDGVGIERFSFCGLSIGGMTGMWLALNAPERLDRLALCCTSPHMPPADMWDDRAAEARSEGMRGLAEASMERWVTPELHTRRPEAAEALYQGLLDTPPEGYAGACEALRDSDMRGRLDAVRAPTLVIAGDEDPSTPPAEHAERIVAAVPDARLAVIERARHLANVERPDEVTSLLLEHLTAEEGP